MITSPNRLGMQLADHPLAVCPCLGHDPGLWTWPRDSSAKVLSLGFCSELSRLRGRQVVVKKYAYLCLLISGEAHRGLQKVFEYACDNCLNKINKYDGIQNKEGSFIFSYLQSELKRTNFSLQ